MNDEKTPYEFFIEHIENASNKTRSGPFIRYDEVKLNGKPTVRGLGKRSAIDAYVNALRKQPQVSDNEWVSGGVKLA